MAMYKKKHSDFPGDRSWKSEKIPQRIRVQLLQSFQGEKKHIDKQTSYCLRREQGALRLEATKTIIKYLAGVWNCIILTFCNTSGFATTNVVVFHLVIGGGACGEEDN